MTTKSTTLLVAALLGLGVTTNAVAVTVTAYTTYTDRALFEAALATSTTENFESYTPFGLPDAKPLSGGYGLANYTLMYFSLESDPAAIKILGEDLDLKEGSHNTTVPGAKFLYLDTDIGFQGSETDFLLNKQVTAFGFDYTGVFGEAPPLGEVTTFKVTIGSDPFVSDPFELSLNDKDDGSSQLFWGVIGTTGFKKVTLITSSDSGYGVDEVTFGSAIPLPPAIWLFGSGLLALAGSSMKRRIRS